MRVRGRTVLGVGGSLKVSGLSRGDVGVTRRRARLGVADTFGGRGRRAFEEVDAESAAVAGAPARRDDDASVSIGRL